MSHNHNCLRAHAFIDAFVRARAPKAQYATTEEILLTYQYFPPCCECEIKPDMLSKMTGRLYQAIWEEHVSRSMNFIGRQTDVIDLVTQS